MMVKAVQRLIIAVWCPPYAEPIRCVKKPDPHSTNVPAIKVTKSLLTAARASLSMNVNARRAIRKRPALRPDRALSRVNVNAVMKEPEKTALLSIRVIRSRVTRTPPARSKDPANTRVVVNPVMRATVKSVVKSIIALS